MLLIIHNLPSSTRYADVKAMIKHQCGLTEIIVDNLLVEGKAKKVTVGLAHEEDAALLMTKMNGLYIRNHQLYVEDVRQKKTRENPYHSPTMSNQHEQEQYNQPQYHGQQDNVQFLSQLPSKSMDNPSGSSAPNFGVPFYMTAQNQKNVGNNPQFMVQYPKVQGSMGSESYKGHDMGFNKQYDGRKRDRSMSPKHGHGREYSPRRQSKWNESNYDRSESNRRQSQYDDDHEADYSSKDKSHRDSYQSISHQDHRSRQSNNNRFQGPSRPEPVWERPNFSTFDKQNESNNFKGKRNVDVMNNRYNRDKEPQRFRENNYSQFRGSDYESRSNDFSKKRPYDSADKNKYSPQIKKFGSNQQFDLRNQQRATGSFSTNYQNKNKNTYINKRAAPASVQQNKPHQAYPKVQQKSKPESRLNNQFMKNSTKQTHPLKGRPVPSELKKSTEEMLARHMAWRVQSAALITTKILNKVGRERNKRDPFVVKLRSCVRARIDVIAGDDTSLTLRDLLFGYRDKFPDDIAFYNAVLEKCKEDEEDKCVTIIKDEVDKDNTVDIKPKLQFIGKPPAVAPTPGSTQRLPKYPDGNKKLLSQLKQARNDEMMYESLYTLDADHEKALSDELNILFEMIKEVLEDPQNETEKSLSKFMTNAFAPDLRKVLTLHIKKRILDVRTNLSVRVICQQKPPKREVMDAFFKDFGVLSLKISDKNKNFFVAICDSYENFDALCQKGSAVIDDLKVSFKPLHLIGLPINNKVKKQMGKATVLTKTEKRDASDEVVEAIEIVSDNEITEVIENGQGDINSNNDKHSSDVQDSQANTSNKSETIPSKKDEDVILIEDNIIETNDVILVNEKNDKNLDDEKVTVVEDAEKFILEDASSADTNPEVMPDDEEGSASGVELNTSVNESTEVDIKGNSEIMRPKQPQIIDNDNIVEDDLEDF